MNALQIWMDRRGLKDHEIAAKIGVSRSQVSRIRRGRLGASVRIAMRLQELTGIKFWRFLSPPAVRGKRPNGRH